METVLDEVTINGIVYVKKGAEKQQADKLNGMPYVIVRTYSAGVFVGFLESRSGKEGVVRQARRLWYWDGAASLSQLAVDGVSKPQNCKFPCAVDRIELTEIVEVLTCTETAKKSIAEVKVWKQ
jgi:hypothetical protein